MDASMIHAAEYLSMGWSVAYSTHIASFTLPMLWSSFEALSQLENLKSRV
jgi:hypothetical protein